MAERTGGNLHQHAGGEQRQKGIEVNNRKYPGYFDWILL
jgi:hypothetical protein